ETATITINGLDTPNRVSTFTSTWQIQTLEGEPFGEPIEVEITTYIPATSTPSPTPTSAVVVSPTPAEAVNFNVFFSACDYPGGAGGSEYRCTMTITPYGGSGLYTLEVFDSASGQPVRYERTSGNVNHYVGGRRCASWIHEIKII